MTGRNRFYLCTRLFCHATLILLRARTADPFWHGSKEDRTPTCFLLVERRQKRLGDFDSHSARSAIHGFRTERWSALSYLASSCIEHKARGRRSSSWRISFHRSAFPECNSQCGTRLWCSKSIYLRLVKHLSLSLGKP